MTNQYNVLLLDDDRGFLHAFSAGIDRNAAMLGIRVAVHTATTPFQALKIMRKNCIHGLFVDYKLQQHNGDEFLSFLEQDESFSIKEKFIVLVSAEDDTQFEAVFRRRFCEYADRFHYLRKPVTDMAITNILHRFAYVLGKSADRPDGDDHGKSFIFACANEREAKAITDFLREQAEKLSGSLQPQLDDIIPRQRLRIEYLGNECIFYIVRADDTGGLEAQDLFMRVLASLAPRVVFFVGCAGLLEERKQFAENMVFVARSAIDYEQREVRDDETVYDLTQHRGDASMIRNIELLKDSGEFQDIELITRKDFVSGHAFIAGENSALRDDIVRRTPPGAAVVEMEAFAVFKAFEKCRKQHPGVSVAVIKGISDRGDNQAQEGKEARQIKATRNSMAVAWKLALNLASSRP